MSRSQWRDAADLDVEGPWDHTGITVRCERRADPELVARLWPVYEASFGPLRDKAAARQVLTREEFADEIADPRVWKYIASDADGQVVGLTTLTDDLRTVPWISPEFYAARHPEQWERRAVFYMGFSLVDPSARSHRVFWAMLWPTALRVASRRGVCAYDICGFNDDTIGFGTNIERLLRRLGEVEVSRADVQTYYATSFTGRVMT